MFDFLNVCLMLQLYDCVLIQQLHLQDWFLIQCLEMHHQVIPIEHLVLFYSLP